MDMRGLDLNLLPVLHVLLEEAHVSRAARRLAMSQPATSSALDRCRHLFGDPLLERVGNTMRPTAKADALQQPLAGIMNQIGHLVTVQAPALEDLRQAVHIIVADGLAAAMAALQQAVNDRAPGISLVLHPWGGGDRALQALARGMVDLAVSVLPRPIDASIHAEVVGKVDYRVVMRRDHPAAQNFDLERWLAWPHIIVSSEGATRTAVDEALADLGLARQIGMVLPSFLLVPEVIRHSQMVALLPAIAVDVDGSDLIALKPPLTIPGFTLHLAWHRRRDQDRAVQFVAGEVRRVLHISNDENGPP